MVANWKRIIKGDRVELGITWFKTRAIILLGDENKQAIDTCVKNDVKKNLFSNLSCCQI
jgi:hypothetical protein